MLNAIRADEEERLGSVLAKKAQEKERQDKEIQRLREQSNELRGWVHPEVDLHGS